MQLLKNIPTNVITGFLGVGKTTAILHLLKQKARHERWAVLVNEFGEVGLDGALITGELDKKQGVFIREIPGGCMCCAAGLPMQTALNILLSQSRPDRLLIEPTGLGHPQEIVSTLASVHYRKLLDIQATLTLVDARKIRDERYTGHDIFIQQLDIADVIVANKTDQYKSDDLSNLTHYLEGKNLLAGRLLYPTTFGKIDPSWLEQKNAIDQIAVTHMNHFVFKQVSAKGNENLSDSEIPDCGYLTAEHAGDGFFSMGWRFKPELLFDRTKLSALLAGIDTERLKAIFITTEGIYGFNSVDGIQSEIMLDEAIDSRIEIIASDKEVLKDLTTMLLQCLNTDCTLTN